MQMSGCSSVIKQYYNLLRDTIIEYFPLLFLILFEKYFCELN